MKYKIMLSAILSMMSFSTFATCYSNSCNAGANVVAEWIKHLEDGNILLYVSDPTFAPGSKPYCTPHEGRYFRLLQSHPGFYEMYATILSAKRVNTTLNIVVKSGLNELCDIKVVSSK